MRIRFLIILATIALAEYSCGQNTPKTSTAMATPLTTNQDGLETATFGQGCFWCAEAIFQNVRGVTSVVSGYSGGTAQEATYERVSSGKTAHAEVVQIQFDPKVISYDDILEIFWGTHDPTTLNRQGNDVGPQYRSVIFYHTDQQRQLAEGYLAKLQTSGAFDRPIVTEISPYKGFYKAEEYHMNYYNLNPNQPYCTYVIRPKLEKFKKVFAEKLDVKKN